jgi:formamidopyrimidine-DNA glycosylase
MPELPDITVYIECLADRIQGERLDGIRIISPSLLRSVTPPVDDVIGREVVGLRRIGKRVVIALEGERFLVIHLMIAGRFQWKKPGIAPARKRTHACLDFADGTLVITEASSKKRATLHVVQGEEALAEHDPGGLEVFEASFEEFAAIISGENHTLKRSLTDPHFLSGIGNAYSDEILHRARLSPVKLSQKLSQEELRSLFDATRETLEEWTQRLREQTGDGFPEKVTAFRPEMAVHGRVGEPCPDCGSKVQRIVRASNESNYCATCQNGGKLLADRALSRLLKKDWPKTLEEMEQRRATH